MPIPDVMRPTIMLRVNMSLAATAVTIWAFALVLR